MKGSNKRKTVKETIDDEVEEMLQAAQDQILLNLSQAHIAHTSESHSLKKDNKDNTAVTALPLDLERRFDALKMNTKSQDDDDISVRFDTLKAKSSPVDPTVVTASISNAQFDYYKEESEEDEEAQVEKLIQWAKDAARLDPSPPSDHH